MYFLTRKSAGTLIRDLEFGREVAFPFVSSLLGNFALNRLERARGAGGRHRAASAQSELVQPKQLLVCIRLLFRLHHMNKPRRTAEAGFRSAVPFSRSGMRLFGGSGCAVRAGLERSDFAVRRVPLIFAWK